MWYQDGKQCEKECSVCQKVRDDEHLYCISCGNKLIVKKYDRIERFYSPVYYNCRLPLEEEMNAFFVVCDVAKRGVSYAENWKALGYKCPNTYFPSKISFLETNKKKKSKVLYLILLGNILDVGLSFLQISRKDISYFLDKNELSLSDAELRKIIGYYSYEEPVSFNGMQSGRKVRGDWVQAYSEPYKRDNFDSLYFFDLLKEAFVSMKLSVYDIEYLSKVLEIISFSFRNVFSEIFKDYDVNSVRNGICNNCGKSYKKYRKDDIYNFVKYCPYCGSVVSN